MRRLFLLIILISSTVSLSAQRYKYAKIIFKDNTSQYGYIENFLKENEFKPDHYKSRIAFKEISFTNKKTSARKFLNIDDIDRILFLDKNMDVESIFDFVDVMYFRRNKRKYIPKKKAQKKLLPLIFENKNFRLYKFTIYRNGLVYSRGYYIRQKDQKYTYDISFDYRLMSWSFFYLIRSFQEIGKDCPAFLDYLKPLYKKYYKLMTTFNQTKVNKQIWKELKEQREKLGKNQEELELHIIMSYFKKYEELCGDNLENSKN